MVIAYLSQLGASAPSIGFGDTAGSPPRWHELLEVGCDDRRFEAGPLRSDHLQPRSLARRIRVGSPPQRARNVLVQKPEGTHTAPTRDGSTEARRHLEGAGADLTVSQT